MSDSVFVGNRVSNVDASPLFDTYSKVIIHIDDDTQITVGNDTGRTLEIDNPFGTREMAQSILNQLNGYQYQPHYSDGALLNPAAEIGDAVNVSNVYGGIYTRSRDFGRLMKADISAPCDEEINHEYAFETPIERKFSREVGDVRATLILTNNMIQAEVVRATAEDEQLSSRITQTADAIATEVTQRTAQGASLQSQITQTATDISAKVAANGGRNAVGSFSWTLDATGHRWYANGRTTPVMEITASGLTVRGTVVANSGSIGAFTIDNNALKYNGLNWQDTDKNYGAYIGASGIQLGKSFSVNNAGDVTAKSLTLQGTLTFKNADGTTAGTMSASDLRDGAKKAIDGNTKWNSAYNSTSAGGYCYGGAGYGYSFNDMTQNRYTATYLHGKYIYADNNVNTPILIVSDRSASWHTKSFYDYYGNQVYISYLGSA